MFSPKPSSMANDLRLEGAFHDAVLKVREVKFKVHKIILARRIPYFRALFSRWSETDQKVYSIPGLSPAMMELILVFAYTGSVSVTAQNVQELLMSADQFNVTEIVQTCSKFLEEQLNTENCIGIWQLTNVIWVPDLQLKALRHILDHFEEVAYCDEFQRFSAQELGEILNYDELNVRDETLVYEVVVRWVAHAPGFRREHFSKLLSKVRFGLVNLEFIVMTVMLNDMVRFDPSCQCILEKAVKLFDRFTVKHPTHRLALARPRLPATVLLATGGWSAGNPINDIEAYDVCANRWVEVAPNTERPRAYHGTAYLNGSLYYIGGFDRVEYFSNVRRLDLSTQTWHEAAPMHCRRCYVSVAVLDGFIYALGGFDGDARLCTAECYRPEMNQWSIIPPMHEQRSDASCTALHNKIYICGGFNGDECLQTCEYYSPETRQWTMITPMTSPRSGLGVVAYADCVFAVGGFDGMTRLRSAEAYDPHTNSWHVIAHMEIGRSNFGLEVIDNRIFVVGGYNGYTTSCYVECYDSDLDNWRVVYSMGIFRSALSCCVVPRLPNMTNYVIHRDVLPLLPDDSDSSDSD